MLLFDDSDKEYEESYEEIDIEQLKELALNERLSQSSGTDGDVFKEIDDVLEAANRHGDETEENRVKRQTQRLEEAEKAQRIKACAPGLNMFGEKPFRNYTFRNLDLVQDFNYKLKASARGFPSEHELKQILEHPVKFVMFLSPESTSSLIQDEKDFAAICDYLWYSLTSFCIVYEESKNHYQVYRKALFDLLRNYGFRSWKLKLEHVITPLINLGFREDLVCDKGYIKSLCVTHLKFFKLPTLPCFAMKLNNRFTTPEGEMLTSFCQEFYGNGIEGDVNPDEGLRLLFEDSVLSFVQFLSDIILSFSSDSYLEKLRPKQNEWSDTLMLFYVLTCIPLDKSLILSSGIKHYIMRIVQEIFDWFSQEEWTRGGKGGASYDFSELMLCCSISAQVQNNLRTWQPLDIPACITVDHHHNLVERLRILPPSFRGNQIRRVVACSWVSSIVKGFGEHEICMEHNINHVAKLFQDNQFKIRRNLLDDVYAMLSLLRLVDAVFGSEPVQSHMGQFKDSRIILSNFLDVYIKEFNRRSVKDSFESFSRSRDIFTQIKSKWEHFEDADKPMLRQQSIERYGVKLPEG